MKTIILFLIFLLTPTAFSKPNPKGFLINAPMFQATKGISNTKITRIRVDVKHLSDSQYFVYPYKDMPDKKIKVKATTLATKAHFAIKNLNKEPITLTGFLPYSAAASKRDGISKPVLVTAKLDTAELQITKNRDDCKGNCQGYTFKIKIAGDAVSLLVFEAEHQVLESKNWFSFLFFDRIKGRPSYRRIGCDKCSIEFGYSSKRTDEDQNRRFHLAFVNNRQVYETEFLETIHSFLLN
jgi:hypothetical protein